MENTNIQKSRELNVANNRVDYLDIARALGIILMIMGHIGFGRRFNHFIHAFNMPMFFIISGYLFTLKHQENLPFKEYLIKKFKSLIIPYIAFGLFHLCYAAIFKTFHIEYVKQLVSYQRILPIAGAIWFLTALFFTDIFFYLINKYFSKYKKFIIILLITAFAHINAIYKIINLPFSINSSLVGLSMYLLGSYIRIGEQKNNFIKKLFNINIIINVLLIIFTYHLILKNNYINMRTNSYAHIHLFWLNVILSFIFIINLSKEILIVLKALNLKVFYHWFLYIGRNTIVFLCLNQIFTSTISKKYFKNSYFSHPALLKLLFVLIALTILAYIINHTVLRVTIGKTKKIK